MKKLNQYIIKSFLGTFVFTFFIVIFVLLMQFVWKYIDDLVGKGLELSIIGQLFFYTAVTFVPMALPLAILMASLMCFGNFGEHYELVALKASGISIWKVMRPLVYFSLIMSGFAFIFSNSIMPVATLKAKTLLFDVRKQKLAFDIKEGVFYKDIDNYVIYVNRKGKDGSSIYDIKIYDHSAREGNVSIVTADSGYMYLSPNQRNIIFTLYNGYNYTDVTEGIDFKRNRAFERMHFKQERIKFGLEDFDLTRTNEDLFKTHQEMMNVRQLSISLDSLNLRDTYKKEAYAESFQRRMQNLYNLNNNTNDTRTTDSRSIADTILDLRWPLIENYGRSERASVIDIAIGTARNARDNASFNKTDFKNMKENILKHEKEYHKKFTLSIACLIFFFIGAPLGTIIRKGGLGLPVVISVIFFVIYWVTSVTAERMAVFGDLNMFIGVWLSSMVLFPIGVFLTFKATTDAALLDADSWKKNFENISKRFLKRKS